MTLLSPCRLAGVDSYFFSEDEINLMPLSSLISITTSYPSLSWSFVRILELFDTDLYGRLAVGLPYANTILYRCPLILFLRVAFAKRLSSLNSKLTTADEVGSFM